MRSHRPFRSHFVALTLLVASVSGPASLGAQSASARGHDVLVVTGADLPRLVGNRPDDIVAFRHRGGAWEQVPVQIDERDLKNLGAVRQSSTIDLPTVVYVDPQTWTGPDHDPSFDADDELCLVARGTGDRAESVADPAGIVAGSRVLLEVQDDAGRRVGDIYLFVTDGSLQPGAGFDLVSYRYDLLSGDYRRTYDTQNGPNPEDSRIVTRDYEVHFADRWVLDELEIKSGTATGVDILDRHETQFAPGVCNRSSRTMSDGGGGMIANIDGPIRAIRSVVGANSGRVTQRDWIFTERRVWIRSFLRVHPIRGSWIFADYAEAAVGMRYYDNNNRAGFTIDGNPDPAVRGAIEWQLVTGAQGSAVWAYALDTDIPGLQSGSFYFDDRSSTAAQCTGDRLAIGAAGPATGALPNTDPLRSEPVYRFHSDAHLLVGPPGLGIADAEAFATVAASPLRAITPARAEPFGSACPGSDGREPRIEAAGGRPQLGASFDLRVTQAAAGIPAIAYVGASRQLWAGQQLPFDLSPLGATGCSVYVDLVVGLGALTDPQGSAGVAILVPDEPALRGAEVFFQYVLFDRAANPAGIVTSGGLATVLGD